MRAPGRLRVQEVQLGHVEDNELAIARLRREGDLLLIEELRTVTLSFHQAVARARFASCQGEPRGELDMVPSLVLKRTELAGPGGWRSAGPGEPLPRLGFILLREAL